MKRLSAANAQTHVGMLKYDTPNSYITELLRAHVAKLSDICSHSKITHIETLRDNLLCLDDCQSDSSSNSEENNDTDSDWDE